MSRRIAALATVVLAAAISFPASAASGSPAPQAGDAAAFIIVLHDDVSDPGAVASEHARRHGAQVSFVYRHAFKGYAATMSDEGMRGVAADRRVASVERDGVASTTLVTQSEPTWGLDRTDQRTSSLSGSYSYTNTGQGVTAYVIDTGIRGTHTDLAGRVAPGFDAVDGGTADDCNGHGTHVAGTLGGTTYGVAKEVSLVPVRVLDCAGSGSWSGVIAGIDWVTGHHDLGAPAVANMSLGGGANSAVDQAVRNSIADGVSYAIAAGNSYKDACKSSPARVSEAMTISATDKTDTKPGFANWGSCVDWFAPGVNITSAWHMSDTATNTISGTSMAAPHSAGVAALYLQTNSGASPDTVRNDLYGLTTRDIVKRSKTTNDHLLFTNL